MYTSVRFFLKYFGNASFRVILIINHIESAVHRDTILHRSCAVIVTLTNIDFQSVSIRSFICLFNYSVDQKTVLV